MRNFQGIVFYINTNIYGDFQICISVHLKICFETIKGETIFQPSNIRSTITEKLILEAKGRNN